MNFHLELRKGNCRRIIKQYGDRQIQILEVRQHHLMVGRWPGWSPCSIRYYPAIGRMLIRGAAGQYIGWAESLAEALLQLATAETSKVLPENGLSYRREYKPWKIN